jgi:hypothetical protein
VAGVELSWPSRSGRADHGRGGSGAEILAAESMFWGLHRLSLRREAAKVGVGWAVGQSCWWRPWQ